MQVNLVFPPFVWPHVPPLGIAHIKSYVERSVSSCSVKCIDLNLLFHNGYFESLQSRSLDGPPAEIETLIGLSGDVFRGKKCELFFEKESYDSLAQAFFSSLTAVYAHCSSACKAYIEEKQCDQTVDLLDGYADDLLSNSPDVIGFSVMLFWQLYCCLTLAKLIKDRDKHVTIILGGSLLSREIEKLIIPMREIDYIIHGEGEKPLACLLRNLDSPSSIRGVVYKENDSIVDAGYDHIEDLAEMPRADFSDFVLDAYYSPEICIPILSSRGCYWQKCAFCVHFYIFRDCYRVRPVGDIVEELAFYVSKGIRHFNFVDEMISASRFKQISEAIIERGLKIDYYAYARPTRHFTEDVLESMSASGCRAVLWGVESANQRVLDLMNKGTIVEDMSEVLKLSYLAGIKNHVFVIIGFPTETLEECHDTLRFLYRMREFIDAVHDSPFRLHKGSAVYSNPSEFGITKIYDHHLWKFWYQYDVCRGLSQGEVTTLVENLADYFSSFSAYSSFLRVFRDHALIIYSRFGKDYGKFREKRSIKNPLDDSNV